MEEDIKEKTADEIEEKNPYDLERYIRLCKITGMDKSRAEAIEKVIAEKERYKYLYQKALDNTIMSDRELIKFKDTTKEIRKKIEFDFNYCLDDVTADLNKLLGDE